MWELYDNLLNPLPDSKTVKEVRITPIWTTSDTDFGTGLAMTPPMSICHFPPLNAAGSNVCRIAAGIKSWNFFEAAVGLATLNSWYNQPDLLMENPHIIWADGKRSIGIFGGFDELLRGKKVTMIGHGPYLDELRQLCTLSVLERLPGSGDLPDSACEYLLPEQDFVFITATALENKTMERLLALTKSCFTAVWGPSTPMARAMLDAGADVLLGTIPMQRDDVIRIASEGGFFMDFASYTRSVYWFKDPAMESMFRQILQNTHKTG